MRRRTHRDDAIQKVRQRKYLLHLFVISPPFNLNSLKFNEDTRHLYNKYKGSGEEKGER